MRYIGSVRFGSPLPCYREPTYVLLIYQDHCSIELAPDYENINFTTKKTSHKKMSSVRKDKEKLEDFDGSARDCQRNLFKVFYSL